MGCRSSKLEDDDGDGGGGEGQEKARSKKAGKGVKDQTSFTDSLDEVARKPVDTFRFENISTSKDAKKEFLEDLPDEPTIGLGYRKRCRILENCIELVKNDKSNQAKELLSTLDEGITGSENQSEFVIDEQAVDMLESVKETIIAQDGFDWPDVFETQSNALIRHMSPPLLRGNFPLQDTGYIKFMSLCGVKLYKNKKKYLRLLTVLKRNPGLTAIDLNFTGLTSVRVNDLFFYLSQMKRLCCIGLRGNKLDNSCVELLDLLMSKPGLFPKLYWVDMRNNINITHYPQSLLDQFKSRLPPGSQNMDMRDLAEGKGVSIEDENDGAEEEQEEDEEDGDNKGQGKKKKRTFQRRFK